MVGDRLLFRDFDPFEITFTSVCMCFVVIITVVTLLRDFGPYVFYLYVGWLVVIHC
jgi:hypothetical protein